MSRSYTIVGLTARNTVVIRIGRGAPYDTNERPSEWGTWGLSRAERGILNRGLTQNGNDRGRPKGEVWDA